MMLEYERLQVARRVRDLVDATHKATFAKLEATERQLSKLRHTFDCDKSLQSSVPATQYLQELERKVRLYREIHLHHGDTKYASRPSGRNGAMMVDRYKEAEDTALAEFIHAAECECRKVYRRSYELEGADA